MDQYSEQFKKKRRNGNSYNGYILCVNQSIKRQQYLVGKDLCLVNHFLFTSIITNFLSKYELFIVLFIFAFSVAAPVTVTRFVDASPTGYDWRADWVKGFPIDLSCNATQYNQLSTGLQEAQLLAEHARDHTLRFGSKSPFFRKYFGNDTASAEVVGHFENVVDADKSSILFLCDDLDDKCKMMAGLVIGEVPTIVIKLLFVTYLLLPEDT